MLSAVLVAGAVCLSGCGGDGSGGVGGGDGGGGVSGGGGTWLESHAKGYSFGSTEGESETETEWIRYTNDKDYECRTTIAIQSSRRTETSTATSVSSGSTQISGTSYRTGTIGQSTVRTISNTTITTDFVSPTIADVTTTYSSDITTISTSVYDEESGLELSWTYQQTGTSNGQSGNTTTTGNWTVTFVGTASDGAKIYKHTSSSGTYTEYTIKDGVTMKTESYNAKGELTSTMTYSFPDNPTIRSRLPSFTISDKQTCELVSSSSTEMVIRVNTYSDDNVLVSYSETTYKKR